MTYRDWLKQQENATETYQGVSTSLLAAVLSNMGPVIKAWLALMLVNMVVLSIIL